MYTHAHANELNHIDFSPLVEPIGCDTLVNMNESSTQLTSMVTSALQRLCRLMSEHLIVS